MAACIQRCCTAAISWVLLLHRFQNLRSSRWVQYFSKNEKPLLFLHHDLTTQLPFQTFLLCSTTHFYPQHSPLTGILPANNKYMFNRFHQLHKPVECFLILRRVPFRKQWPVHIPLINIPSCLFIPLLLLTSIACCTLYKSLPFTLLWPSQFP